MFDDSDSDENSEVAPTEKKNKNNVFDMDDNEEEPIAESEETEEFVQLLKNLKVNIDEVNNNITPLIERIKEDKIELKNVY